MISNMPNSSQTPAARRAQAFKHVGNRTLAAVQVSKLREGNAPHHHPSAQSRLTGSTTQADLLQMSQEQQVRIIDNENALALMPEIEWACRVLVSSILSPKDMAKRDLIYSSDLDWIPPTARSAITEEVKKEMNSVYDYSNSLYHIFKDCLFTKGSHPRLVLPEAAVDKIINSGQSLTLESLSTVFGTNGEMKRKGYFGKLDLKTKGSRKVTMESFRQANASAGQDLSPDEAFMVPTGKDEKGEFVYEAEPFLSVSDNFDAVKLPYYLESVAAAKRSEILGNPEPDFGDFDFAVEATESTNESRPHGFTKDTKRAPNSGLTASEFRTATYKSAPNNMVTHLRIPGTDELKRRSVGRPLVLSWPSEAVMTVHVPGDVKRKLGFIGILDETGYPVSLHNSDQLIGRAQTTFNAMNTSNANGTDSTASSIISKAARNLKGGTEVTTFREASRIFEQLLEDNIIPRLMNGAYPGGAQIADSGDLYTLMMARTLCSMRTRLVFIPAEMMSYFAFDYHHNGMGKSLLDSNKILISIRAGLLLTRMTGEIRNSIPLTKITMKIDEDDADWEKTWSETQDIVSKTRQPQYPLSTLAVNDLMDWIHRAGFIFAFEGHPRIPDTGFEFEKIQHENKLPDQEFYDQLGRQLYMGFGIPPELMDSTYDSEFAIAIASRNIMFTQTILEYQKIASGLITDDHHRLILADGVMMNTIVGIVRSKWGEITQRLPDEDKQSLADNPKRFAMELVKRIVTSIRVSLPEPDSTTLENQYERFSQFKTFMDEAFEFFVSESVISADIAPELAQKIASMGSTLKAAHMREYLSKNNMLPELFQMSATDEEGKPAFDILAITEAHTKGLGANLMSFAKAMAPMEEAIVKDSQALNLGNEVTDSGGGGYSSGGGDFGGGGEGDGFGDLSFELPGEDTPSEEATSDDDAAAPTNNDGAGDESTPTS